MKEINLPSGNYLFVEVPDNAYDFSNSLHSAQIDFLQDTPYKGSSLVFNDAVILRDYYHDKFKIISTTKDITEEQCIEHFTGNSFLYSTDISGAWEGQLYSCDEDDETLAQTAKESLQSLIQANGLDINKNYLILRMI